MRFLRPFVLLAVFSSLAAADAEPFEPTYESLEKGYRAPEWFRDAKLGFWAHWGPQSQPEKGDWYARLLYGPKVDPKRWEFKASADFKAFHQSNYGNPSEFGYKDILPLWRAEKWDPEALMDLYVRCGAKYFVSMGNHHDNFDLWNSVHHEWNSVNVGPKKDVVAIWKAAALKRGLRFGVSVHAARAWSWFEPSRYAEEEEGPFKGRRYDGWLTKADGTGKWWQGLDPQNLYLRDHAVGTPPDEAWSNSFFLRTKQLLDDYAPDLLYYDDHDLPLGETGLRLAAYAYNRSAARNGGKVELALNIKNPKRENGVVLDIERGGSENKRARAWQVDTCLGGWFYNRSVAVNGRYKSAEQVLKTWIDVVSKNGNLLLSVPQHGDGTIDPDVSKALEGIAAWNKVNGEAVFGSRPWVVFGEGTVNFKGSGIGSGDGMLPYGRGDFRYVRKGDDIYAFAMAKPRGTARLVALAEGSKFVEGDVKSVELLGKGACAFRRAAEGLLIDVPADTGGPWIWTFRIRGLRTVEASERKDLLVTEAVSETIPVPADATVRLGATEARIDGKGPFLEAKGPAGAPSLGGWNAKSARLSWKVEVARSGEWEARIVASGPAAEVRFGEGDSAPSVKLPSSGDAGRKASLGRISLETGVRTLVLAPGETWNYLNFVEIELVPVKK